VFFGLVFFHLLGFLLIPALGGSTSALINVVIYSFVFVLYLVLRVKRTLADKRQSMESIE
jgi:DMSO/TMAO reductase YedYZ heme-binding membrane subunit